MDITATQVLSRDDLTGCSLDQRWSGEKDGALITHDDGLVRHRRHIGTTGGTRPHDHGNLRQTHRRHIGLIVKYPTEMIAVGKDFVLIGQIGAAAIDQIDARQPVLHGDFLRPQVLFYCQRVIGPAFDGRIIAQDHHIAAGHPANAGDQSGAGNIAPIHAIGRKLADLEKRRIIIEQPPDALARQQLATPHMALAGVVCTAFFNSAGNLAHLAQHILHGCAVVAKPL